MEIRNATVEEMDGTATSYSFLVETAHGLRCYVDVGACDLPSKSAGYRIIPWFNVKVVEVAPKLASVPDRDLEVDPALQMQVPE